KGMCSSFHIPKSSGDILPSGDTAVASVITKAAPPTARLPKCTRCQSLAKPSSLEYSHIGETIKRFLNSMFFILTGENKCGIAFFLQRWVLVGERLQT